jgi:hypothetical protein
MFTIFSCFHCHDIVTSFARRQPPGDSVVKRALHFSLTMTASLEIKGKNLLRKLQQHHSQFEITVWGWLWGLKWRMQLKKPNDLAKMELLRVHLFQYLCEFTDRKEEQTISILINKAMQLLFSFTWSFFMCSKNAKAKLSKSTSTWHHFKDMAYSANGTNGLV